MSSTETLPCPDSESPSDRSLIETAEAYTRAHPRAAREERHLAMLRQMQDDTLCIQTLLRASAQVAAGREAEAAAQRPDGKLQPVPGLESIGRAHANSVRAARLLMMTEIQIDDGRIARLEGNVRAVKAEQDQRTSEQAETFGLARLRANGNDEQYDEVRDVVETMIEDEVGADADRADAMLKGLYRALDAIRTEDGFSAMPVGAVVARICNALGFTPDWDDWADQEWARDEAALEMEGSPYCPEPRVVQDEDGRYRFSAHKRDTS